MSSSDQVTEWLDSEVDKYLQANSNGDSQEPTEATQVDVRSFLCAPADSGLAWSQFHDVSTLQAWVADLQWAIKSGHIDDWQMAGANLALECQGVEALRPMLDLVAADLGFAHAHIPDAGFAVMGPGLRLRFEEIAPVIVSVSNASFSRAFSDVPEPSLERFARDCFQIFDPEKPVVFVMTTPSVSDLGSDLLGLGLFDRQIILAPPPGEVVGRVFLDSLGAENVSEELRAQAGKVGLFLRETWATNEERDLARLQLRRRARRLARPLTLDDLLDLSLRGAAEHSHELTRTPDQERRRKTAYHEAGHACVAVIDSNGRAVPDYASIVPARDFAGVVMPSLHYASGLDEEFTFADLLLRVRISLAGRAAEELFFGSLSVSSGADHDLATATRSAYRYFAHSGFHPAMVTNGISSMNLAVQFGHEVDPMQNDRITSEVRGFLAEQYLHVTQVLQQNRAFVDAVVDRLMWDPVVDQQELTAIAIAHGIFVEGHGPAKEGSQP